MAAAAERSGNSGIFWMRGVSDEEQPLVFVPGVEGEGKTQTPFNFGPGNTSISSSKRGTRMRARRSFDCKTDSALKKVGYKQGHIQSDCSELYTKGNVSVHPRAALATEHIPSPATGTSHPLMQVISDTSSTKSLVCLKDLCPEDKRRIANLIEELARVSEEKEESVQRLKDEQETFEHKITQLEQQNQTIAQERESLQQQYRECQELLGLYQQYLSQQQAKLNQSIAQLSQAPSQSKVLSSEEAPSRTSTNGSLCDGSYLGLAATRAQQPLVHRSGRGGKGAQQTLSAAASSSHTECSPTGGPIKQHRSHKRQCRPQHSQSHQCHGSGQDSGYGTQQRRSEDGSRLENCHHSTFNQHECESGNASCSEAKEALTRPLGQEDWEEKRHQLLLQKMQLETERERLHTRLAEQQEQLNRQNQQLHQAHLDHSRFQQATNSDLSSSNTRNRDPRPEVPSHKDLPSSVFEDAEVHSAIQSLHEKTPQTVPTPLGNAEALKRSRKDVATSPSPAMLSKLNSVPVIQKSPEARLDFSVVELLDIFTPISAPELSKPSTRRPKTLQRRPAPKVGRTLLTPAGPYPPYAQQELEESQILEDIFFIC